MRGVMVVVPQCVRGSTNKASLFAVAFYHSFIARLLFCGIAAGLGVIMDDGWWRSG